MRKWTIALMLITLPVRLCAYKIPYETWLGTYVGGSKIGYVTFRIDKADTADSPGYRISSIMSNRLTLMGTDLTQLVTTTVYTDEQLNPLREQFEMSSGGRSTSVSAEFKKTSIECVLSTSEGKSHKSIPIPAGARLVGDAMFAVSKPNQKIGTEYKLHYFNPLTLTIDELNVKVERREKITVAGKSHDTVVLRNVSPMGEITIWQDESGDILRAVAMAGITMVRETKEEALSGIKGTGEDFAVMTAVKPNRAIPNPRQVKVLDIIIRGIDDPTMAISDSRQSVRPVPKEENAYHFRITATTFAKSRSARLPIAKSGFEQDLASTPYFDYDLGDIAKTARKIVGSETNAYEACSKIRSWLYQNMRMRADVGISRPASDVLQSREGVCRDYAILFAAMARSLGIPARIASGLEYTNGAFYYHAWVECYVGKWVPFDGTLATDFVDATHIKLAQGSAASMFGLARVIGSLEAEIKGIK